MEELSEFKTQRSFTFKGKDMRVTVILECTGCDKKSVNKESTSISSSLFIFIYIYISIFIYIYSIMLIFS
nr:ribosomal protein L33 [Flemingia sp.]